MIDVGCIDRPIENDIDDDDKTLFKNHTLASSTFADFHEGRVIHTNTKKREDVYIFTSWTKMRINNIYYNN